MSVCMCNSLTCPSDCVHLLEEHIELIVQRRTHALFFASKAIDLQSNA